MLHRQWVYIVAEEYHAWDIYRFLVNIQGAGCGKDTSSSFKVLCKHNLEEWPRYRVVRALHSWCTQPEHAGTRRATWTASPTVNPACRGLTQTSP